MAHYDFFREELAKKFSAYGHALWEPNPGELYGPVAIGDVGYIRRGKFHTIFNVFLPEDHPTHANFGTPEYHEPLSLKMENHIDTGILSPNDFCSAEVRVVSGGLNIFSSRPEGSAQASFECSKRRGALLSIPVPARREDTEAQGQFRDWIIKHIDSWFSFAQSLGLGLERMEDIILVTGCHRTRSYTNILFSESREGARVSFGVRVGSSEADIAWEDSREQIREVQIQRGPNGDNLPENQCIFVRGLRASRFMGIFPASIRGEAGLAPLGGSDSHNPPAANQLMSTSIPESNNYQDPLHVLLKYMVEKEPDSDIFLVHDDDLAVFIEGKVIGSLQRDTLMDSLRNSQLKTVTHDCGYLAGSSRVPVKVGMFSERALDISLGSKSPNTLPPEFAQVSPTNSIESEGSTPYQQITSPVFPTSFPMSLPHSQPLLVTRNFLNDGYISYTFTPQIAEFFLVKLLFKVGNSASIQAIRDPNGSGAYFAFNNPSHYSPPPLTISGRGAWVLDYDVRSGGSVVPQELWVPQSQGDRRRYADQVQIRMPVFFVCGDGSLGVPLLNAAAGHMQLRDVVLPPPLQDKTTSKIRIAWPGHGTSEQQVQLRDQTPQKNPIAFDRFVKHVGSRVRQFLMECERVPVQQPFKWMVGHGNITPDEVMLIGIVQVSEGNWMPILQLMTRVVV